jgi:predicted O-methyltransferase YrrM
VSDYLSPKIDGWMGDEELRWLYETAKTMKSVVEIGSWKGRSTHAILSGCRGPVWAVDHFMGSPNELEAAHREAKDGKIYDQFIANVGMFPNLTVLRMPSVEAARKFSPKSVDMIFIDGCHVYEDVHADIAAWLPIARKIISGHDVAYAGIQRSIRELLGDVQVFPATQIWWKVLEESNG